MGDYLVVLLLSEYLWHHWLLNIFRRMFLSNYLQKKSNDLFSMMAISDLVMEKYTNTCEPYL